MRCDKGGEKELRKEVKHARFEAGKSKTVRVKGKGQVTEGRERKQGARKRKK